MNDGTLVYRNYPTNPSTVFDLTYLTLAVRASVMNDASLSFCTHAPILVSRLGSGWRAILHETTSVG
jgi:hypothetical protein